MSEDGKKKPDDLTAQLSKLPEETGPGPHEPEAMCYEMAEEPTTAEHHCRSCGMRTEYPLHTVLPDVRCLESELPSIPGFSLQLDDREFCESCTPPPRSSDPEIVLVARREAAPQEIRTRGFTPSDLERLRSFKEPKNFLARLLVPRRVKRLLGL